MQASRCSYAVLREIKLIEIRVRLEDWRQSRYAVASYPVRTQVERLQVCAYRAQRIDDGGEALAEEVVR
jgi:hypothetical protein